MHIADVSAQGHLPVPVSFLDMTTISDTALTDHHARITGKTVIITGAGAGIGKETAGLFASYGAKVVVADKDFASANRTASQIRSSSGNGDVVSCRCDVTDWDELVALYELAMTKFGSVDVVVANAGVGEVGGLLKHPPNEERPLAKPRTTTVDVNLTGLLYSNRTPRQHYLQLNRPKGLSSEPPSSLKSVILLGSVASWFPLVTAPVYTTTKHAVLDTMRSLDASFTANGVRIASVHPFFADTSLVPKALRYSHSSRPKNKRAAFLVPDGGALTFMIPREEFKLGMYQFIDKNSNAKSVALKGPRYHIRLISVLAPLFWKELLLMSGSAGFMIMFFWKRFGGRFFTLRK
ncbi:hypothetical protein BDP27DRAFT_1422887 [Rhodocollybia butyracea]|uniref:NAD(P)-binding protein n=1 Tax=Rhodocollybia butyracea TaxID=206335 RepID=A0A9P5PQC9_9AGAR|nr:hypothetical protein BDP27DRAFT_1422887 [Rhodocollybia butyracea]